MTSDGEARVEVSELDLTSGDTFVLIGRRMRRYDRTEEESWTYDNDLGPAVVLCQVGSRRFILTAGGSVRIIDVRSSELVIPVQVSSDVW